MEQWRSSFLTINGVRLHVTRTSEGTNKPPLVLAHGFSDDGLCWTPLARELEAEWDLIMPDARGHGRSEAPEGARYGYREQSADLAGIIGGLGLHRPPILGHSMGAATALALAGFHPNLPGALLLEDPPPVWTAPPPSAEETATPPDDAPPAPPPSWITALEGKTRQELVARQQAETPHWSEEEIASWADAKLRFLPLVGQRRPGATVDWCDLLPQVACPTLLLGGDPARGSLITSESAAALDSVLRPGLLRVVSIDGAGHSIRRDRFVPYVEAVRAFLHDTAPP